MAGRKTLRSTSTGAARRKKTVKEKPEDDNEKFLASVDANSNDKDVQRLMTFLWERCEDVPIVQKCCEAVVRTSGSDAGFFSLYRYGAIETLTSIGEQVQGVQLDVQIAYSAIIQAAAKWLAEVDHVEFFKLPQILEIALRFAGSHKAVALSAVSTLDRFAMQQQVHRVTILKAGGLHLLHEILATHRAPEFCQETIMLMYHVCDVAKEVVLPEIVKELSLINTVIETLDEAPVNMRLQFTGLKLIALLQNLDDKRIQKAFVEANAQLTLQTTMDNLNKGGFVQAAAWLHGITSVAFEQTGPMGKGKKKAKRAANLNSSAASARSGESA